VCDVGFVVKLSARALRRTAAAARKQRRAPNRWSRAAWSGKQLEAARPEFLVVGRARISLVGGVKPEQGARGKDLGEKSPPPDTWARQREGEANVWATTVPRAHAAAMRREASGLGRVWVPPDKKRKRFRISE
jgi:hypothetical protein